MFSFIIWDSKEKKIFGARDFFGIKPMYYAEMNGTFLFGSEIKGFIPHPAFKKELDEERLPDYLTFSCIPCNGTFFKNVFKLPSGHYFEYANQRLKIEKYFNVDFDIDESRSIEYFSDKISASLEESVLAHKISDVEVGCFLSGGVDSGIVTYELSKLNKIKTFTIGFEDKRYSEDKSAKELANEIGVSNELKIVSAEEYFQNIGKVQYHLDEPLANPSANLLYFLSHLASKDVKVVLSGEGADEMFGGYNVYKEPLALRTYQNIPVFLRKGLAFIANSLPEFWGRNFIIRGSKKIEERYFGNSNIFSEDERMDYLNVSYKSISPTEYTKVFANTKNLDDITKMQYLDIHMWMVQEILLKADKMSMANSLELRVPFLDIEIFKLARTVPTKYKVDKTNTKLALRNAAAKKINLTSANRTKMAFPLPLTEWLREDKYYSIVKEYFKSDQSKKKYFSQNMIMRLLDEHKDGKKNNTRKIWTVLTFLVWYDEFCKKIK